MCIIVEPPPESSNSTVCAVAMRLGPVIGQMCRARGCMPGKEETVKPCQAGGAYQLGTSVCELCQQLRTSSNMHI
jgi:hypothetical protein